MVYYPQRGSGPRYQMNSQRGGEPVPRRRQDSAYYYPQQIRRQDQAYFYPNEMIARNEGYNYPYQTRRQDEGYYDPRQERRGYEEQFYPREMRGQSYPPPTQRPRSRFERLPDQLNSIAGHMGTINQGINIMRQVGSLLSMFRKT